MTTKLSLNKVPDENKHTVFHTLFFFLEGSFSSLHNFCETLFFFLLNFTRACTTFSLTLIYYFYSHLVCIFLLQKMKKELLKLLDCNVIVVDWSNGSGPPYPQAVANIRLVGTMTAHLINNLIVSTGIYN